MALFIDDHGAPTQTPWRMTTTDLLVVQLAARAVSG
jgi:hypothetical protein